MVPVFQLAHMEKNSKRNAIIQTLVQPTGEVGENVPEYWTSSLAAE